MTMTETAPEVDSDRAVVPGRTRIMPRALNRVVSAITADALGVPASRVGVDLNDDSGSLSLTVSTPIRVPSLNRVENEPSIIQRHGGPVLERAKVAQEDIRNRTQQLTGFTITRVIVTITGIDISEGRRVK